MVMPGMDGLELAEALREVPHAKKMPVILLSSGGMDEIDPARRQVGYFSSIPKPWKSSTLPRELERAPAPGGVGGVPLPMPKIEAQGVLEPDSAEEQPAKI